ncbi:NRDE2-like protein, partial [Mya arenaria]
DSHMVAFHGLVFFLQLKVLTRMSKKTLVDIPETSAIIKPVVQVQEVPKATAEDSKSYTHVSEIQEPDIPGQDYKRDKLGKKKKRRHKYSSGDSDSEKERYDRKRYNSGDSDSGSKDGRTYHKERKKKRKTKDYYSSENEDKKPGLLQTKHIFLNDVYDIAPDHPFKLDRAPDKNSLTYGSLYTGHVAEYRTTCNQCVGSLGKVPMFVYEKVKKKDKSAGNRYYDRENRKLGNQYPKERIVMNLGDSNNVETMPEFVAFGKDTTIGAIGVKVGDSQNVRDTILDPATSLYVQGMGGKSEIDNKEDIIVELDETRVKVVEYNRKLRENPGSIKLWLDFAKFQDSISAEANLKKESVNEKKMTEKAVLEKKISIIEKALGHNPGHIDLLLAKIELSAEIVDSSKINKDLEQLLFVHPANTKLWKYHLMFNQSRLTVFTVAKQCKLYHKCFKMLLKIHTGVLQTHSVPENLEHEIIERALATFQAILEYNLFCPPLLKSASKESKMAAFEEFWDNESAKIGTQGACGWNQTGNYSSTLSGLVHRARSWLEHSLSTTCLEHSILLWRLYLTLESEVEGGGRLKGVFYRAVQHCPWAKSVYLDGVRLLGEVQLQEIVDLMTEKEIRVHLPTEELDILISP